MVGAVGVNGREQLAIVCGIVILFDVDFMAVDAKKSLRISSTTNCGDARRAPLLKTLQQDGFCFLGYANQGVAFVKHATARYR